MTLEPAAGGARVTLSGEGEVNGFARLAEPVMASRARRHADGRLANLKDVLEAEA